MVYKFLVLFVLLCVSIPIGFSGTIDPIKEDSKYTEYAASNEFECVIQIGGQYDSVTFKASAVAIDNRTALTAAHVVKQASNCYLILNDKKIKIHRILCHKDFNEEIFGVGDIAICYCEEDIGLSFFPTLYQNRDEEGKYCSIAGYGVTGTFLTGSKISDNKKRAGLNNIDYIQDELLVCSPSKNNHDKKTNLEFIISHGDSGGGLFIDKKLAGINSSVMAVDKKPDSSYTDESCHTRISTYLPWIKENTNYEK